MAALGFKRGLNRVLDDAGHLGPFPISRKTIRVYGDADWPMIKTSLSEWERAGFLSILADPETSSDDAICVEMRYYIDGEGGWPQLKKPT
jgi:hypothetical protein